MIANKDRVFQVFLLLLPHSTAPLVLWLGVVGLVVGCMFWLYGVKFSKTIVALVAVLAGGIIGLKMPAWCGWSVDSMGTAVAGALLLGFLGLALHRLCIGIGLGVLLACWTTLAAVAIKHIKLNWTWPDIDKSATLPQYLQIVWNSLPMNFSHIVMIAFVASLVAGIVLAATSPRLNLLLFWSWAGSSLAMAAIAVLLLRYQPMVLARVPTHLWLQASLLAGMVGLGMLLQMRFWRKLPHPAANKPEKAPTPTI